MIFGQVHITELLVTHIALDRLVLALLYAPEAPRSWTIQHRRPRATWRRLEVQARPDAFRCDPTPLPVSHLWILAPTQYVQARTPSPSLPSVDRHLHDSLALIVVCRTDQVEAHDQRTPPP